MVLIFLVNLVDNIFFKFFLQVLNQNQLKKHSVSKIVLTLHCANKCSSDLKKFANSRPSASYFKTFSWSLKQIFYTVGQNNFGNKIPGQFFWQIFRCFLLWFFGQVDFGPFSRHWIEVPYLVFRNLHFSTEYGNFFSLNFWAWADKLGR